jgi:hypothetical protein
VSEDPVMAFPFKMVAVGGFEPQQFAL